MGRWIMTAMFLLGSTVSLAVEKDKATTAAPEKKDAQPAVATATPLLEEQEEVIFERSRGLYFEGRGGVFFTVGGARGYSNGQPMFGFELGYDITEHFSMQIAYTQGYQSANPLKYPEQCSGTNCSGYHLDFGLTMFNVSMDIDMFHGERWAAEFRGGGGAVIVNPSAKPGQGAVDFDVFGGFRFEYYTLLRHFNLAAEADFYYVLPSGIPALSVSGSVMYNF